MVFLRMTLQLWILLDSPYYFYKGRDFDHMPPSSDAILQRLLRVAYQVRQHCIGAWYKHIWKLCRPCIRLVYITNNVFSLEWTCVGEHVWKRPCYSLALSMGMASRFPRLYTNACICYNSQYNKGLARACYLQMQELLQATM